MPKSKEQQYYLINIKIKNNIENKENLYLDLFDVPYKKNYECRLRGDDYIKISSLSYDDKFGVLIGRIDRYTKINSEKQWFNSINNESQEGVKVPNHIHPNDKYIVFYFFKEYHRLVIPKIREVSLNAVFKCIENSLKINAPAKIEVDVIIEKSKETIYRILNSNEILSLEFKLSFTNDDTLTESAKEIDLLLKNSNTNDIEGKLKSINNAGFAKDSKLIKGIIGLSESNGSIISNVINSDNKREKINTDNFPKIIKFKRKDNVNLFERIKNYLNEENREEK